MSRNTQWVRDHWTPACQIKSGLYSAYSALDKCFKAHSYRLRAGVTGAYNCRRITGGSGWSLHAYGPAGRFLFWTKVAVTMAVAVDVNWDKNPYGKRLVTDMPRAMINDILAIRTVDGLQVWRWGGYYSGNKDAMHFELIVSPAELARGIDWSTVSGGNAEEDDLANVPQKEWDEMKQQMDRIEAILLEKDPAVVKKKTGRATGSIASGVHQIKDALNAHAAPDEPDD